MLLAVRDRMFCQLLLPAMLLIFGSLEARAGVEDFQGLWTGFGGNCNASYKITIENSTLRIANPSAFRCKDNGHTSVDGITNGETFNLRSGQIFLGNTRYGTYSNNEINLDWQRGSCHVQHRFNLESAENIRSIHHLECPSIQRNAEVLTQRSEVGSAAPWSGLWVGNGDGRFGSGVPSDSCAARFLFAKQGEIFSIDWYSQYECRWNESQNGYYGFSERWTSFGTQTYQISGNELLQNGTPVGTYGDDKLELRFNVPGNRCVVQLLFARNSSESFDLTESQSCTEGNGAHSGQFKLTRLP